MYCERPYLYFQIFAWMFFVLCNEVVVNFLQKEQKELLALLLKLQVSIYDVPCSFLLVLSEHCLRICRNVLGIIDTIVFPMPTQPQIDIHIICNKEKKRAAYSPESQVSG